MSFLGGGEEQDDEPDEDEGEDGEEVMLIKFTRRRFVC